jgi:hypothetical protein
VTELIAEDERAARLIEAQGRAVALFAAVEQHGLIAAGVTEVQASDAIRDLAAEEFYEELLDLGFDN